MDTNLKDSPQYVYLQKTHHRESLLVDRSEETGVHLVVPSILAAGTLQGQAGTEVVLSISFILTVRKLILEGPLTCAKSWRWTTEHGWTEPWRWATQVLRTKSEPTWRRTTRRFV
jgi:hypothetical protein